VSGIGSRDAPVLVRDNQVIVNADGSSIDNSGSTDATLMLYASGKGRYIVSLVPFEGAVQAQFIYSLLFECF